jgi:hypothetical protein
MSLQLWRVSQELQDVKSSTTATRTVDRNIIPKHLLIKRQYKQFCYWENLNTIEADFAKKIIDTG